ncbi:peptide chain release factor 2 [Treponema endosymbiont of Eucomonympha sp.]|uniref:peptide chain release factor 2 n=1 Tax=Treponema endosymbiont of Eucomonympha sp. TaxID=1580831 RepID=UPI0013968554|nr:peptide chain release factor 2 [Treponema endosymbiont of Eucomonympha sp.]
MLEDYKIPLASLKTNILNAWGRLDAAAAERQIADKEARSGAEGFWDDPEQAEKTMSEIKTLKNRIEPWRRLVADIGDAETLYQLGSEAGDGSVEGEVRALCEGIALRYETQSTLLLLSGEADRNGAFLTIHAGAGGTEACDWAQMLCRMYTRWAEEKQFKADAVDMLEAEGGIKSITLQINGDYAYGYLQAEAGIHRLVRISPFDANARRHTSFSSVYVFPVLDDTVEVDIRPEDLRVDTYRSGGAGGQHVNKTDSAVRFTHLPTGIVVACQSERSQTMNRAIAMNVLRARLYDYYKAEKEKENAKFATEKKGISWGNQIRSYVFQPYTMVKDHRTKTEIGNIQAVMDGKIDLFIEAYLQAKQQGLPLYADGGDEL